MCALQNLIWQGNEVLFQPAKIFLPAIRQVSRLLKSETLKIHISRLLQLQQCDGINLSYKSQIFAELEEKTRGIPGARLEDNRFCISVHFREVKEVVRTSLLNIWCDWSLSPLLTSIVMEQPSLHSPCFQNLSTLQEKVRSVVEKHPDFHLTAGKKVQIWCSWWYYFHMIQVGS